MKKKAVAYIRVSTTGQIDGYGLDAQEAKVRRYAQSNNLEIARVFREEGVSGTHGAEARIAWVQLLDYMEETGTETIIIPELSRLARDLMVQESIIRDLRKRNLTLVSVDEPDLLSNDPSRKLIRQIMGAINEYEREIIIVRMAAGRLEKARRGEHAAGRVPLGYTIQSQDGKRLLVQLGDEAVVIERIFQLVDAGVSYHRVAKQLNDEGIHPKNWCASKPTLFHASTIRAIYQNQKYRGVIQYHANGECTSITNESLRMIDG